MAMKGQATLCTPHLDLVPLRAEHRPHTMALDMDPLVMKTVAFGRAFTEDEAIQVHTWLMQSAKTVPGFGCWAGFTKDSGEFVGWWILASCSEPESTESIESAEIKDSETKDSETKDSESKDRKDSLQPPITDKAEYGFRVAPKFWGKGFAKEGAREMVRHAFQDLELAEVIGETMTVNGASRAVMAGSGLMHVDTFFNTYDTPPAGIEEGEVRYSIRREDWLSTV
jgi:RimJ/RimL family protein N-acetyltransferase